MPGSPRLEQRSDYASTRERVLGAWVLEVVPDSPAWEAGLEPGMRVDTVNGVPLDDIITWRWEADGDVADLVVYDPTDGERYACTLERSLGQDWGVTFTDVLFDGIRTCVNACQFCFMSMLPKESRSSLMVRDDDYRLSFLQGNFVTLTNLTDDDVERIIRCRLEPMNVSIHAITPDVRIPLIGRHAMRGVEVIERLCDADIEMHGQIVLCPGINDGDELRRTLDWVEERPQITSLAIVPLGYTKYSRRFSSSFSEDPDASRAVLDLIRPYQDRARLTFGTTRFQVSDEFYLAAHADVPEASAYDGYPQYHDGIGMLRCFIDETARMCETRRDDMDAVGRALVACDLDCLLVCGEAASGVIASLCDAWGEPLRTHPIRNDYFGGDVNVTGLIVAEDLLRQLPKDLAGTLVVLPEVMFNFERVTLDGVRQGDLIEALASRGACTLVVTPNPLDLLSDLMDALELH